MSKKNRKTRKEKEVAQSTTALEKAKQIQAESKERKARQEQERLTGTLEAVQSSLPVKLIRIVLLIYLFLLLVALPLYVHDAYNDIGTSKFNFYAYISFGYVQYPFIVLVPGAQIICLGLYIWYMVLAGIKGVFRQIFDPKKLTIPDWFVLAYMLASVLSAAFAPDKSVVLWGFPGWFMGMISQLSFGWLYFLISRFLKDKRDIIFIVCCMMFSLIVVGTIGIIHRHGIDLFGLYEKTWGDGNYHNLTLPDGRVAESVSRVRYESMLSTVGNQSWYGMYLCLIVPVAVGMLCYTQSIAFHFIGLIGVVIGAMAMITADSANIIAGLMGIMLVFLWDAFRSRRQLRTILGVVFIMLVSWQILHLLYLAFPDSLRYYGEKMMFYLFAAKPMVWITIGVGLSLLLLAYADRKGISTADQITKPDDDRQQSKLQILRLILFSFFAITVLVLTLYVFLNTTGHLPESLRSTSNYLVMDIHWGHYRMQMWVVSLRCFMEKIAADPLRALFGMGPDSMYQVFQDLSPSLQEDWLALAKPLGVSEEAQKYLTNTHSEWITMFLNLGIPGGVFYISVFITAFVHLFRRLRNTPILVPFAASLVGYMLSGMFSYQQILSAPVAFVILGLGMWVSDYGKIEEAIVANKPEEKSA